jgi:hypothetical protein
MRENLNFQPHTMGLIPRVNRPEEKKVNYRGAIMVVFPSFLPIIIQLCFSSLHFSFGLHQASSFMLWCGHWNTSYNLAIRIFISMPRERGKSCHDPTWYTLVARQKRQQSLRERFPWPALREFRQLAGKGWLGCLQWRTWRRSSQRKPYKLLQSLFFSQC